MMITKFSMYIPLTTESGELLPEVHITYEYVNSPADDWYVYKDIETNQPFYITGKVMEEFIQKGYITLLQ